MNTLAFVVMIVAISCCTGIVIEYLKTKRQTESAGGDIKESLAQIEALEERMRVLERIITENKFDLKREIDKL